ncbi:MAG: amidohydrolase, partial [Gammaproteobacteria bacterium]|nr:amidohydrolase [Gammaproteobacteria bacterium]
MAIHLGRANIVLRWLAPFGLSLAALGTLPAADADLIYVGRVITMTGTETDPRARAEAVAVAGDRIIAVGSRKDVLKHRGKGTRLIELGDKAVLPGFIDAHGHLTATSSTLSLADLSAPPVGEVRSIADLQNTLRRFIAERRLPAGALVIGFGYDDAQLKEKRHPNRDDLDAVSSAHPIMISHVSGHLAATNSAMLKLVGIEASTPDPAGGVIRRRADSREPDGVLEETAFNAVREKVPPPNLEQSLANLAAAQRYYARMGVTTVQDGALVAPTKALLDEAARRGLLDLDVVTYQLWSPVALKLDKFTSARTYDRGLKHHGIKLILDGSPQGKTAFLSQAYRVPPAGQKKDYSGYPTLPAETVKRVIAEAAAFDIPVLAHANGDAAAEMLIDAVAAAKQKDASIKPDVVMIHAQTVRDDQLDRMASLGMTASFFVGHVFYWGDWHREETLGPVRADRISPTRSALDRKVAFTLHTDTPVVPPNMISTLWSATTRRSRSGDILGPAQRLGTWEALSAITLQAARQSG